VGENGGGMVIGQRRRQCNKVNLMNELVADGGENMMLGGKD